MKLNKFLLAGNKFMPEMDLKQPRKNWKIYAYRKYRL